ncbi:ATP-binding protein [Candidatus Kaiserbacteria bacterium]|nr:ATP-binding protein [Candidatus Kaiserbacteria bacterium]
MFVNRKQELAFLNSILAKRQPAPAQLVLLYGRRRVGKTVLARHWAERTKLPTLYWAAEREPAPLQRRKLFARILNVPTARATTFDSWADLWQACAAWLGDRRQIFVLDEITYAAGSDPAFLSALQHAWDQHFKKSGLVLILSGSHVHTMETLLARGSPLFGRFTGQWHLQPLEFATLREFLPRWQAEQRVAAYAIVGGVPAYLEKLDPSLSLSDNIREIILGPGSMFVAEPELLLYDEVQEPRVYRALLQAIGAGAHSLDEIANASLVGKTHLPSYLARLQELRFVERRLPVTIPVGRRSVSRLGRYHLTDPFLRFYFRFVAPVRDEIGYQPQSVLPGIQEQLRAFVGATAFEELCRQWVRRASAQQVLPFEAQHVGSHWSRGVQVDVVAINWQTRDILLGECKWGTDRIAREMIADLIDRKTPLALRTLPEEGKKWTAHWAFFSRAGLTPAAQALAEARGMIAVDLARLDRDLTKGD